MGQDDLPDIVVVDKHQRTALVVDVVFQSDSNIRKKEYKKLQKYQRLKKELVKMWGVRAAVMPVVIVALGAITPKMSWWLQQIPGTSEISIQKSAIVETAKILLIAVGREVTHLLG